MKRLLTKDLQFYQVWPDGTVQDSEDRPYEWKSDDYLMVEADSEEEARSPMVRGRVRTSSRKCLLLISRKSF